MQFVNCFVRLNGSVENEVARRDISVAEVSVLRALHGADAVVKIEALDKRDVNARAVKDHLMSTYSSDNSRKVVEGLFPGMYPKIPETLGDVGLELAELAGARRPAGATMVRMAVPEGTEQAAPANAVRPIPPAVPEDEGEDDGSTYAAADAARRGRDDD